MIEVKNLRKSFAISRKDSKKQADEGKSKDKRLDLKYFHAVQNVSFNCNKGEVLGLLGPNGAGKTTTLRMLSTAYEPSAGEIIIEGQNIAENPLYGRKNIGFLSGSTGLYRRLTVRENIEYFGRLHGMDKAKLDANIDALFDLLDMHSFAHKKADDLSTGMKQKTAIARSVVHEPKVVIFDEPTTGLDVMSAKIIIDFIASFKEKQIPVIFSTHHLHEVEAVCDRVTVIDLGTTCFSGTTDEFRQSTDSNSIYDAFISFVSKDQAVEQQASLDNKLSRASGAEGAI